MPLPWSFNQWACNPYTANPDRDAAADKGEMGGPPPPSLADVLPPKEEVVVDPDFWVTALSPAEHFVQLTKEWPEVPDLIPASDHISGRDMHDVLDFINRNAESEAEKRYNLHCFDYAHLQLHNAGYWPSGPGHKDSDTLVVLVEYLEPDGVRSEVQVKAMISAVVRMKVRLELGIPMIIGLRLNDYDNRPNKVSATPYREATNHFVVAIGMGHEDDAYFIRYMDYLHRPRDSDRLYLTPDLRFQSADGNREMTEVRNSN